ncbi:MAG: hypothetical protein OJF50_005955 [Nitrospira sp.]|nr:hypothetical protein [Nitrospira sp.]
MNLFRVQAKSKDRIRSLITIHSRTFDSSNVQYIQRGMAERIMLPTLTIEEVGNS